MGMLDGKVAVVTGGGTGIGRAVSLDLARARAKVVVNDRSGLPLALQIVGRRRQEAIVLRVGVPLRPRRPGQTRSHPW